MVKKQMTTIQYVRALAHVGKVAYRLAPSAGRTKLADSVIQSVLPIATTYFAALTTSALADAYAGDTGAGGRVLLYVMATSIIGIMMLAWSSVGNYISQKTRYQVEAVVEDNMMRKFSSLPYDMYDDKSTIDLHEKAKRFSYFFSYIFDTLGRLVAAAVGSIGAMIALLAVSPWVALAIFLGVIPGVVIQIKLSRRQSQHWQTNITRRRRKGNLGWMLQEPQYIAEMRVYGVARHLIKTYGRLRDQDEKERLHLELGTTRKQLAADIGESLVELGSLVWIVLEVINRHQPVGQFLYVQQMVGRALGQAGSLASGLGGVDQDLANIVDYQHFMELPTSEDDREPLIEQPSTIAIDKVSFKYPKTKKWVISDISFSIARGQHVAIVGENGAGKSTLVKLIMGLYAPTKGAILVDGKPLEAVQTESWHKYIGLLDQNFVRYFFATIRENISLGDVTKTPDDKHIREAARQAEFTEVIDKLEYGDATYIERWMAEDDDEATATELSGGQYQRLALARNFYRDAPILILDEPTSAIDALAESRIFERLFSSKKTVIAISHRFSTIKKADIVYMMKNGEIVEMGKPDELIAKKGDFFTMFESQIG